MTDPRHYYLGPWTWRTPADMEPYWSAPDGTLGLIDLRPISPVSESGFFTTAERMADETGYLYLGGGHLSTLAMSPALIGEWRARLQIADSIAPTTLLNLLWLTLTVYSDPDGDGRTLPLMPTHDGRIELHLGGHSLIKSEPWQGVKTPHWGKVQRVMQNASKKIKQKNKALHGKWLKAMADKFKVDFKEIDKDGKPEKPTTTISDAFTGSDGVALGLHIPTDGAGWSWTVATGSASLFNNSARFDSTGVARAERDLSSDDMSAQALMSGVAVSYVYYIIGRYAPSEQTFYSYTYRPTSANRIRKTVNGSETLLSSIATSQSGAGICKIICDGSTISSYFNGALIASVTDTSITSYTRSGMGVINSAGGTLDNFEAADLLAGPGPTFKSFFIPRRHRWGLA